MKFDLCETCSNTLYQGGAFGPCGTCVDGNNYERTRDSVAAAVAALDLGVPEVAVAPDHQYPNDYPCTHLGELGVDPAAPEGDKTVVRLDFIPDDYLNVDVDLEVRSLAPLGDLTDPQARKNTPITTGVLDYFPDAIAAVAQCSKAGNDQHNPGQPLHWAREKSTDHADCISRHLIQRGTFDSDGIRHSAKLAWRALANLQVEIEGERNAR